MSKFLFLILFRIYQTADYNIDLGIYYDSQKQGRAQGYIETFTIKDEGGKEQFNISITKLEIPNG